jgi:hypothetical protein
MVRKFVFTFVVAAFSVGILSAAELTGFITKVDGNKITFQEFKFKKGEKPEKGTAKTLTVAKNAKVQLAKGFKKDAEASALEGGLTNKRFKDIDAEKGVFARITTNDESKEVTAITVVEFGKGFGKKKKDAE